MRLPGFVRSGLAGRCVWSKTGERLVLTDDTVQEWDDLVLMAAGGRHVPRS